MNYGHRFGKRHKGHKNMREKRVEETASLAAHKATRQTRLTDRQAGRQVGHKLLRCTVCPQCPVQGRQASDAMTPSVQLSICPSVLSSIKAKRCQHRPLLNYKWMNAVNGRAQLGAHWIASLRTSCRQGWHSAVCKYAARPTDRAAMRFNRFAVWLPTLCPDPPFAMRGLSYD